MTSKLLSGALALSTAAFLLTAAPIAIAAGMEPHRTTSVAPNRQNLTIYSRFGIVQQTNGVNVQQGANAIRFEGIAGKYEPSSLVIVSANGVDIKIKDVSYQPANLNLQSMLQASVGTNVTVLTAAGDRVVGTLLSYSDGNLLIATVQQTATQPGPRVIKDPKEVQFSGMPLELSATPSLTLNAEASWAASGDLQILYKTNGLSWSARYSVTYNEQRGTIDVASNVAIVNQSGTDFKDAGVKVVSGNIQDGGPTFERSMPMAAAAAPGGMSSDDAAVGSLGEQKIYTLGTGIDIKDGETKQVPLYTTAGVSVDRVFYMRNQHVGGEYKQNASVRLVTVNDPQHKLGRALPAGAVRFFQNDPSGQLQLSGAGTISASEPGEKMFLEMGTSTDVKSTWSLVGSTPAPRAPNGAQTGPTTNNWSATFFNSKNVEVQVKVYEPSNGVRIGNTTSQWQQEGANQFTWVRVPARQQVTLTYSTSEQN